MKKQKSFKENGITLIALIITIIILLILAGVTIAQLTESGLFDKARLAQQKSENAQIKEETTLGDYENKIGEYVNSDRETVKGMYIEELWTGEQSSGTLTLSDSIYNYNFLVVSVGYTGTSDIITINKDGMSEINGGGSISYINSEGIQQWGFYISSISEDGKELILTRAGIAKYNVAWSSSINVTQIIGIR